MSSFSMAISVQSLTLPAVGLQMQHHSWQDGRARPDLLALPSSATPACNGAAELPTVLLTEGPQSSVSRTVQCSAPAATTERGSHDTAGLLQDLAGPEEP